MRRAVLVVTGLWLCSGMACTKEPAASASGAEPTAAPAQAAAPADAKQAPPTQAKEDGMGELYGTWTYADDPKGEVSSEAIYQGSAITLGEDGSYTFRLGGMPKPLTGTWKLRQTTEEGVVLDTSYGEGRTNVLHLAVRRGADGKAQGFVVREGEERVGGRYYSASR